MNMHVYSNMQEDASKLAPSLRVEVRSMDPTYETKARLLRILANPIRLEIVDLLRDREMTVTEISHALGARQAATSQHLAVLRNSGILESRKERNFVRYKLADQRIGSACRMMNVVVLAVQIRESLATAHAASENPYELLDRDV